MIAPELERRIRDSVARWNRGDHTLNPEWTHPDVEIHAAAAEFAGTIHRGLEGVERWVADMRESFDEWQLEVHELEESAPGRVLGVWDHVDGVLTRFEPFPNRVEEAREAATR
jgi:hypothetical protein